MTANSISFIFLLNVLLGLVLVNIIMPYVIRLGKFYKLLDYPSQRSIHSSPTPRIGGVAIFISYSIIILIN